MSVFLGFALRIPQFRIKFITCSVFLHLSSFCVQNTVNFDPLFYIELKFIHKPWLNCSYMGFHRARDSLHRIGLIQQRIICFKYCHPSLLLQKVRCWQQWTYFCKSVFAVCKHCFHFSSHSFSPSEWGYWPARWSGIDGRFESSCSEPTWSSATKFLMVPIAIVWF